MNKASQNALFFATLFVVTFAVWVIVRYNVIRPQVYQLIDDFKTEVILPKEEKAKDVKTPAKKPQVSAQTKANTVKANALKQCSNVTIGCMAELERIARDTAARQSVRGSK